MKNTKLAIKDNNAGIKEFCAICRKEFEPDIGLALFMANNYDAVCDECGKKCDPRLYRLLEVYRLYEDEN